MFNISFMCDQALMITIIISLLKLDDSLLTNSQIDERTMVTMELKSDLSPNIPNLVQREKIFGVKFWTPAGMAIPLNNNKIPETPLYNWNLRRL